MLFFEYIALTKAVNKKDFGQPEGPPGYAYFSMADIWLSIIIHRQALTIISILYIIKLCFSDYINHPIAKLYMNYFITPYMIHKDFQGQGIASIICDTLENVSCSQEIVTHASITAKPFFEKCEYRVIQKQLVEHNEIFLMNYVMTFSKHIKKEDFADEMSLL